MEVLNNIPLDKKTTFHVGGVAKNFYVPESVEELQDLIRKVGDELYIISGGSNLIINDTKTFEHVCYMQKSSLELINRGDGEFYIGASNRIQKVISYINENGYGGFEELIGLPAMFGGIVYMNAGIGGENSSSFCISDFIISVRVIDKSSGEIIEFDKTRCLFSHRTSVFQNDQYVIIGATIKTYLQDINTSKQRIQDRREHIKKQIWDRGCFGSCFAIRNRKILKIVSILPIKFHGVKQDSNNPNWLVNTGGCTYKDVMRLINLCIRLHKITFNKVRLEVRIWD